MNFIDIIDQDMFYLFGVTFNKVNKRDFKSYDSWVAHKKYFFDDVGFPFTIKITNNTLHHFLDFEFVTLNLANRLMLTKEVIYDSHLKDFDINEISRDIERNILVELKLKLRDSIFKSLVAEKEVDPIYDLVKSLSTYTGIGASDLMEMIYKHESFTKQFVHL